MSPNVKFSSERSTSFKLSLLRERRKHKRVSTSATSTAGCGVFVFAQALLAEHCSETHPSNAMLRSASALGKRDSKASPRSTTS